MIMTYCPKCGEKNEDDARYCNSCGAPLTATQRDYENEHEDRCEEECAGGPRSAPIIWGLIVVLIGLWIVFKFGLKNIQGLPAWVYEFEVWWIIPVIIGIAIIIAGIRMIIRKDQSQ
jgi:uncharacterized membrane protein YvbJ